MENNFFNIHRAKEVLGNLEKIVTVKDGIIFEKDDVTPHTKEELFNGNNLDIQKLLSGRHPHLFIISANSNVAYALLNTLVGKEDYAKDTLEKIESELKEKNGLISDIGFGSHKLETNALYGLLKYALGQKNEAYEIAEKIFDTIPKVDYYEDSKLENRAKPKQKNIKTIEKNTLFYPYTNTTNRIDSNDNALYASLNFLLGNVQTAKNMQESIRTIIGNYEIMSPVSYGFSKCLRKTNLINNESSGFQKDIKTSSNASFMLLNSLFGNHEENNKIMSDLKELVPHSYETKLFYQGNRINGFDVKTNLLLGIFYASDKFNKNT